MIPRDRTLEEQCTLHVCVPCKIAVHSWVTKETEGPSGREKCRCSDDWLQQLKDLFFVLEYLNWMVISVIGGMYLKFMTWLKNHHSWGITGASLCIQSSLTLNHKNG